MRKQGNIKEATAVVQVKTGGGSLSWGDGRCREVKTRNPDNSFEEVCYRRQQKNTSLTGKCSEKMYNY